MNNFDIGRAKENATALARSLIDHINNTGLSEYEIMGAVSEVFLNTCAASNSSMDKVDHILSALRNCYIDFLDKQSSKGDEDNTKK